MKFDTLEGWLVWLEQLHPAEIDLGLERVREVASKMELLPLNCTVITVAGTNGKGSTIAALNALLNHSEPDKPIWRIGVYTSPHLQQFNERIAIEGNAVSDHRLCTAFERVEQARLTLSSARELTLSYFEFTTLAALLLFKDAALDCVLLEVGLGGRLDAVNLVDPDLAVITRIGIDHQQWLGNTREQIAIEKAGILRQGIDVVVADRNPPATLIQRVQALNCTGFWLRESDSAAEMPSLAKDWPVSHGFERAGDRLNWGGYSARYGQVTMEGLDEPQLNLASWSAALQVALLLNALPATETVRQLMRETSLAGRQSTRVFAARNFLLDVAHNDESVAALAYALRQTSGSASGNKERQQKTIAIFAAMADKPVESMLGQMDGLVDQWIFPAMPGVDRAATPDWLIRTHDKLRPCLPNAGIVNGGRQSSAIVVDSVAEAIDWAVQHTAAKDKIVVFGSFYTVGAALDYFAAGERSGE